jgi:hypothetical protein
MRKTIALALALLSLAACSDPGASSDAFDDTAAAAEEETDMMAAEEPAMFYPAPGQDFTQGLQRTCMERVFAQDAQAASADPAQQTYRMRQIDTANCPADFRVAYFDHTAAWEEFAKIRQAQAELNSEESQNATIGASVIATILDIDATPIADHIDAELRLQRASEEAAREIDESFRNLERIALSYGVANDHRAM